MALMDFVKKQFIDIIEWTEGGDGTLAWRFPMADREIQNGASLTVRERGILALMTEGLSNADIADRLAGMCDEQGREEEARSSGGNANRVPLRWRLRGP